jgi:glutamate-ammonia-ligase adenylyltransferase
VKLLRGGLVDLEFLVHYLQLRYGPDLANSHPKALFPDLASAIDALCDADLVEGTLADAHALMTTMLVAGRLLAPGGAEPPPCGADALALACGRATYAELVTDLTVARHRVARAWTDIFEQQLEI